ncbi:RusA family crossover junction endodeoxyribonuclease [Actinomadura hibisca]|uniref:RusA family crossover junction endodeoxyribonuclease n=1 Tax=Actinomadura hibisca TaxID=68565 RepID=UPI000833DD60|nr:RusA family crossover junction endodeoxyribonuclease [Actinomadura hibisca]
MTAPALVITVHGVPGPQGSKRPIGNGRMIESSKKVAPWRKHVAAAALAAAGPDWTPLDGPLRAEFVFSLPRGKTVRRPFHTTYPDLSKLIRSTEDALTTARIWADDARLVAYHQPRKIYAADPDPDALTEPGAVIRIWTVTP